MREKLIELLSEAHGKSTEAACFEDATYAKQLRMEADHLIANGVTFGEDINAPSKWIPVSERLPERNKKVLVCDTREDYVSVWERFEDGLWFGDDVIWGTEDITHWMPLPEPPKGE